MQTTDSEICEYSAGELPILYLDRRGETVEVLQRVLRSQTLYNGQIDRIYGIKTRQGVIKFQRSSNLTVDGIVGPNTWKALKENLSCPPNQ
ncbi:MAG: peptidoglycan-binding domain-containing protein [Halothece sp.]